MEEDGDGARTSSDLVKGVQGGEALPLLQFDPRYGTPASIRTLSPSDGKEIPPTTQLYQH